MTGITELRITGQFFSFMTLLFLLGFGSDSDGMLKSSNFNMRPDCLSVLVEDQERAVFLDGAYQILKQHLVDPREFPLSIQYGIKGLSHCLDPAQGFRRIFILPHSMEQARAGGKLATLVYYRRFEQPNGTVISQPMPLTESMLLSIQQNPFLEKVYIATCYPEAVQKAYPRLLGSDRNLNSVAFRFAQADGIRNGNPESNSTLGGAKLVRTSLQSALNLFAEFVDFR